MAAMDAILHVSRHAWVVIMVAKLVKAVRVVIVKRVLAVMRAPK
jgi:hypothetical protein